jgi:transcription factor S
MVGTFCPKCGGLLTPSLDKKSFSCSCGYTSRSKVSFSLKEKATSEQNMAAKEQKKDTLAKVNEECPKCACSMAYNWSLQTRSADEAETQFFRCTECNHTWREYA